MANYQYYKNFIESHIQEIEDNYKITSFALVVATDCFKKETGYYLEGDWGRFSSETIGFESKAGTYEDLMRDFNKFNSANDKEDLLIKKHLDYPVRHMRYIGSGEFMFSNNGSLDDLLSILLFVVKGDLQDDRRLVIKIMDDHDLRYNSVGFEEFFPELDNISIKIQKNGKIKVKGLDNEELETLQYVFDLIGR